MKILILGGTVEGRNLATKLTTTYPNLDVVTSLAGATKSSPNLPGKIRIGGFGGVDGLAEFLKDQKIKAVIDATHPFASTITKHAIEACSKTQIEYLRLDRPEWVLPENADVVFVPDAEEAARLIARTSSSAFLTIGRKDLSAFQDLDKVKLVIRTIEDPDQNLDLIHATYVMGRPPFALDDEIALLQDHQIDTLVSKASGGDATCAKIYGAAKTSTRIILIRRPALPECERVQSVEEAVMWLRGFGVS